VVCGIYHLQPMRSISCLLPPLMAMVGGKMGEIYSFSGGEGLRAKLDEIMRGIGDTKMLRVGFLEGATCGVDNQSSAPQVAFWLEFGTMRVLAKTKPGSLNIGIQGMPPRPFFSGMIANHQGEWPDQFSRILKAQNYNLRLALMAMGQLIADQLQKAIIDFNDPPDSEATLRRKAFKGMEQATLQESKNLLNSVSFEVIDGLE
jgi:hypothetical protein